MTMTFFDYVDITPTSLGGTWVDTDLSAYLPAGATGAALCFVNGSGSDQAMGARKHGDTTDAEYLITATAMRIVPCDANRHIDVYTEVIATMKVYLMAALDADWVLLDEDSWVDVSIAAVDTWTNIDITAYVGADTPTAAVLFVDGHALDENIGFRADGSSWAGYCYDDWYSFHSVIVPLGSGDIFEAFVGSATVDIFLQGYIKGTQWTFDTAPANIKPGTANAYVDLAALPAGATAGLYCINQESPSGSPQYRGGAVRKNGSSADPFNQWGYGWDQRIVEGDASRIVEAKLYEVTQNTALYRFAYYTPSGGAATLTKTFTSDGIVSSTGPTISAEQVGSDIVVSWS